MFSNIDINTMWNKFIIIVEEVIDKILKQRNYLKWMIKRAKLTRKLKSTMWARFRLSKEYTDWVEYKRAKNRATAEYRRAKSNFFKKKKKPKILERIQNPSTLMLDPTQSAMIELVH